MVERTTLNAMLREELERAKKTGLEFRPVSTFILVDNSTSHYGCIHHTRGRSSQIYISKHYLNAPVEEIRTVICHEVCHAVKGSDGHDAMWQKAVRKMRSLYDYVNADYHLNAHPYSRSRGKREHTSMERKERVVKYVVICTKCNHTYTRTKRSALIQNAGRYRCGVCNGELKLA